MFDADKKQFSSIVRTTMLITGGVMPESDVMRIWWAALQKHDIADVSAAFSQYAQRGKFPPRPADIIELLDQARPDGRIGVDEAWAICPRNEAETVVWTQEIAEAFSIASPLLEEGDKIAARMAFKDAYARIVSRNKMAGVEPIWSPSLGHDMQDREQVLREAVRLGRISSSSPAIAALPAPNDGVGISAAVMGNAPLRLVSVNGDVVEDSRTLVDVQERIAEMKRVLKRGEKPNPHAKAREEEKEKKAEIASKVEAWVARKA